MDPQELQKKKSAAERRAELDNLEPIDFATLESVIKKWMLIPDFGIIKLLAALYIANSLSRRAVWCVIIGPSGGGKTELLNGLSDLPNIYEVSLLTPNTFLSGMPGKKDASLLPIVNGKIMVFKDWTSILSMNKDARQELMGQFREIWDGRMKKIFGNGKIAEWSGKVGIIAASTSMIDLAQQMHTTLGERFINYRLIMPNRKEVARRSLDNDGQQEQMGMEIRNAFYSFIKGLDMANQQTSPLPNEVQEELIGLANLSTIARSGVIRESGSSREIVFVPSVEMPTRILQQLNTIAAACVIVNQGEYKESDMKIIYKIALDSIPQTNKMVMLQMARGNERTTAEIATALGYPTTPIRMYLENLAVLGVCQRIKGKDSEAGGTSDRWTMYQEFVEILRRFEKIETLEEEALAEAEALREEENKLFGIND